MSRHLCVSRNRFIVGLMNYVLFYFLHFYELFNVKKKLMDKHNVSFIIKACRNIDFGHNPNKFLRKKHLNM